MVNDIKYKKVDFHKMHCKLESPCCVIAHVDIKKSQVLSISHLGQNEF